METKIIINALRECKKPYTVMLDVSAEMIADRLEELESELQKLKSEQQPEWISVEDRLPEEDGSYAVIYDGLKKVYVYYFESKSQGFNENITHWMPLPEPPKPKVPSFKDVFLEKFPKADIEDGDDGNSMICRNAVFFGRSLCSQFPICSECWNQHYFEEEGEADA